MSNERQRWVFSDAEQDKWLYGPFAIISDPSWYMDNDREVRMWLEDNTPGWSIQGVVINFENRDQLTMFRLRWA